MIFFSFYGFGNGVKWELAITIPFTRNSTPRKRLVLLLLLLRSLLGVEHKGRFS